MSGRTILNVESPKTQTVEAVKSLLAWKHHPVNPLPCDVSLENGRVVLVLSNKKDCFYVTTARACSCPAHNWHPGQRCKHQRKYFLEQIAKPAASESGSIRPAGKWAGGMDGPVDPDELRRPAKAEA
jgi:hypothetical protein